MSERDDFLGRVDTESAKLAAALKGVPRDRVSEPGVSGKWSVKDIVGHVATWDQMILEVLQGKPEARVRAVRNVDEFNAAEWERRRRVEFGKLLREMEATHAALRDSLEAAPAEVFDKAYPHRKGLHDDTHLHYAEHADDIARWLARK